MLSRFRRERRASRDGRPDRDSALSDLAIPEAMSPFPGSDTLLPVDQQVLDRVLQTIDALALEMVYADLKELFRDDGAAEADEDGR